MRTRIWILACTLGALTLGLGACEETTSPGGECLPDGVCDEAAGENRENCAVDCPMCDRDFICETIVGETTENCVHDCPICDDDGVCDEAEGETRTGCPGDCPVCDEDDTCEAAEGETRANCSDCPICNHDATCDATEGETFVNCVSDCPYCDEDYICEPALGETAANCPTDCHECDNDGHCEDNEPCSVSCTDCCPTCDLASMFGTTYDVIIHQMYLPESSETADDNGVDVDGDGTIDNKLGSIIAMLSSFTGDLDLTAMINQEIASGSVIILARVKQSGLSDGKSAVQIFQGEMLSPPLFNGSDQASIAATSPQDVFLCGDWAPPATTLETAPGFVSLSLPLGTFGTLTFNLFEARIETATGSPYGGTSAVRTTGWTDVMIGGGLTKSEINTNLLPTLANILNGMSADYPQVIGMFDGGCSPSVGGCSTEFPGQGQCASDGLVTATELRCSILIDSALMPDVDVNGDGVMDLVSLGLRVMAAVPVTITP